jgi:2-amino-4-hydroxy-6-hydroxymethyldihydropteridine diphosphokinase
VRAYVALGSNQGECMQLVVDAMAALDGMANTRLIRRSFLYRTAPWGVTEQPDFINAAVELDSALEPRELLDGLLEIERVAGRKREGARWGPRTLDLDLLDYAGRAINEPGLTLPHPRIAERAFVLLPLADLAPDLEIPGQGRVADLLAAIDLAGCHRLPGSA